MFGNRKEKANEKKIKQLSASREESRRSIRRIRKEMEELVQKAAVSDELDGRIYSADYLVLKEQLRAEMLRMDDATQMIIRLKNDGLNRRRAAEMEEIVSVNDQLDLDRMVAREDYMNIRREMMLEEAGLYQDALSGMTAQEETPQEDEEFIRLVNRARVRNSLTEEPEPAKMKATVAS